MKKILLLLTLLVIFKGVQAQTHTEWKDVASIFYNNCASCHRPGEIGENALNAMGYSLLLNSPNFTLIPEKVNSRLMPPWPADPNYVHFLDERVLSDDEINKITDWVDEIVYDYNNSIVYEPGDTTYPASPNPPVFPEGSQLGTPDTIIKMAEPFVIPGDNKDHYQVFVLHTNLNDDREVRAIEFRAGSPTIVHHVFMYTCIDNSADSLDETTPEYGYPSFGGAGESVNADFLTLYGPGLVPRFYPDGCGLKFKAGTRVLIQIHYAPTTVEQTDQSSVNLFYGTDSTYRKVKGKRVGENYVIEPVFFIKKESVLTFHSSYTLDTTYSMFSIAPHMHLLGKEMKIWAVVPEGDSIPLVYVDKWDFRWQMLYSFNNYIILPQGTVIHAEATYDNTDANPDNPNSPPENVEYGESSFDEMFKYFMNLVTYQPGDEDVVFDSTWHPVGIPPIQGIVSTPQLYSPIPNPSTQETIFNYYLPHHSDVRMYVYDLAGRLMNPEMTEMNVISGFHRKTLDVSRFAPGTYFFTLDAGGKRLSKSFVVQH